LLGALACKPQSEILPPPPAEITYLKSNCSDQRGVEKVSTVQAGDYFITRYEPDACGAVGKSHKRSGGNAGGAKDGEQLGQTALALQDGGPAARGPMRASNGLAVLVAGNGAGGGNVEPRVATNLSEAETVYRNLGYDVITVNNPTTPGDVSSAIQARYPDGYSGPVETIVHGHGSVNPTTGLHEIAVNRTNAQGQPETVSVATADLLAGSAQGAGTGGTRTAFISSCQSGQVCSNVEGNADLSSYYDNVLTSSRANQLSSDLPTTQPGERTNEAGLANYLAFRQNPSAFDANSDGNVTGTEFAEGAYTPGGSSYVPSALLRPTNRQNEFVQVDTNSQFDGLDAPETGRPNVLTPGEGGLVVENRERQFNQNVEVLRGDNILYSDQQAAAEQPAVEEPAPEYDYYDESDYADQTTAEVAPE
jgi:hypothetical protein